MLGFCERSLGQRAAAAAAWAHVPPASRFAIARSGPDRAGGRARRLADAERLIHQALADRRIDAFELALEFGPVYGKEGRVEEAQKLIEAAWTALNEAGNGVSEPAILLVRLHIELRSQTDPVAAIRSLLDRAGRSRPRTIASGWGKRTWRFASARMTRLGGGSMPPCAVAPTMSASGEPGWIGRWLRIAWRGLWRPCGTCRPSRNRRPAPQGGGLAGRAAWGSPGRTARLESVIRDDPTDFAAYDRLIERANQESQPGRAAELRGQKSEIQRIETRYQKLYRRNQPTRDAAEMAHLAEQLGREFEARGFLTVATAVDPDRADLRDDLARINQRTRK